MSSATSVNEALEGYAAGRLKAEQLVGVVAAAYYEKQGARSREQWRPIIDVIERAHPGFVELSGSAQKPGFSVRLAERPFPKRYEGELREAVQRLVEAQHAVPRPDATTRPARAPGILSRMIRAVRRLFTAST